ncbi:hypothetical protein [Kribbella lupini]
MRKMMMSVAAIGMLVVPVVGAGSAAAAVTPDDAAQPAAKVAQGPSKLDGYWCDQSGIGTENAYVTCHNETDQARYAHFHVDCWALGDNDTDQTKWVGPWGSVSFNHYCWSHAQSIEGYFQ